MIIKINSKSLVIFLLLIMIFTGCSYSENSKALSVAQKFYEYIKGGNYKKAYEMHVKNVRKEEVRPDYGIFVNNYQEFIDYIKKIKSDFKKITKTKVINDGINRKTVNLFTKNKSNFISIDLMKKSDKWQVLQVKSVQVDFP